MPSHGLKEERVRELAELVQGWGKLLAGEAFPDGPSLEVDLAGIEELTTIMQQALLKGLCEEATQRQAERLPASRACPNCGKEADVESADDPPKKDPHAKPPGPRPMQLRHGTFELKEPRCYCRACRRYFFPSADRFAD